MQDMCSNCVTGAKNNLTLALTSNGEYVLERYPDSVISIGG